MSSGSCCGGSCGCGSSCKFQGSCGGCKMNSDINNSETTTTNTTISGVAPTKSCHEGSEMGAATSEHDGCKCGASCTCNPCTCK